MASITVATFTSTPFATALAAHESYLSELLGKLLPRKLPGVAGSDLPPRRTNMKEDQH